MFFNFACAQEIPIIQYSSFCESNTWLGEKSYRERIVEVERTRDGYYAITAMLIRECGQPLFPLEAVQKQDTLFVSTTQITMATLSLDDGRQVSRVFNAGECHCVFEFRMEIAIDSVSLISFDGRVLEKTEEEFHTYPIKYFTFKGDTTGYIDKYGIRHGDQIIQRKTDLLKVKYKDGSPEECELLTLDGKVIANDADCFNLIQKEGK